MCLDTNKYLKTLEDLVLSEEKIITYKWLSKRLSVHTNTSKQLLYWFYKKNKEEVAVTYVMSGFEQEGGVKVSLVRGDDLVRARQAFTKVISEHVYSVHKTSNLDDSLRSLCLTDRLHPTKLSSIVPREVGERQVRSRVCEPPPPKTALPARTPKTPLPPSSKVKENKSKSPSPVKAAVTAVSPKKSANKPSSAPKGGIGAMFKKQEEKSHVSKLKTKSNKKLETVQKEASPELEGNEQDVVMEEEKDSKQNGEKSLEPVKAVKDKGKKNGASKRASSGSGSKRKKASARSESTKKRRRINVMSDSDSDESGEEEEELEEEPLAHEEPSLVQDSEDEVIPPTPHGKPSVRRLVNKTYTDDDGFIVTRKEYVYESCEEEEESEEKSKQCRADTTESRADTTETKAATTETKAATTETKAATTESRAATTKTSKSTKSSPSKSKSSKKKSPNKNKQQSIMSFFKKK